MQLGYRSPWDSKKPHYIQQEFLKAAFRPRIGGIAVTHMVGGRGVAKTSSLILALLESALNVNPGLPHLWSAPTFDDCTTNFLQRWRDYIPEDVYDIKLSDRIIYLHNSTGKPTPIFYRGRDISNQKKQKNRGPDWAAVFYDEPRQDPTDKEWKVLIPAIRDPRAKQLMLCTGSTPLMNWYYHAVKKGVESGFAIEINGTSWDNPHQPRDVVEMHKAECDRQWAEQEIEGKWVSLSSRAWDNANLKDNWPEGNMHPHKWDPSQDYILACDLGVRSGWVLIQTVHGHEMMIGSPHVDVIVAEYTPNHGDTDKVARDIDSKYGEPAKIIVGNDVNTPSLVEGSTSALAFRNMGWSCPIVPVKGRLAAKDIQYLALKKCLENALGNRTLCISRHLMTYEPHNRGVIDVLNLDAWPEDTPRSGEFLPKDKKGNGIGLEDIRDALMYYAIVQHPIRKFGADGVRRAA